jgi:hypothetical protein
MKRHVEESLQFTNVQIELDNSTLQNNVFLPRNKEIFIFRDFIHLLRSNITREEVLYIQKEMTEEMNERNSVICAMIPDDVWMSVFRLLAHHKDICTVFHFKQVCKRWDIAFPLSLSEAFIYREESMKSLLSLPSVRSLRILKHIEISLEVFQNNFTKLNSLFISNYISPVDPEVSDQMWSQLTNLKNLEISQQHYTSIYDDSSVFNNQKLKLLTNLQSLKFGNHVNFFFFCLLDSFSSLEETMCKCSIFESSKL